MRTNHAKKTINDGQRSTRVGIMNSKSMFTSRLWATKSIKTQSQVTRCQLQSAHSELQLRECDQIIEDAPRIMPMVKDQKMQTENTPFRRSKSVNCNICRADWKVNNVMWSSNTRHGHVDGKEEIGRVQSTQGKITRYKTNNHRCSTCTITVQPLTS